MHILTGAIFNATHFRQLSTTGFSSGSHNPHGTPTNQSSLSLKSPTTTAPATLLWKDPDLTGCYAGNGGSTILTLTSGDQLIIPTGQGIITTIGVVPQTFDFSCSEFFELGDLPFAIKSSFARSPVCASYVQEIEALQSVQATATTPIPTPLIPAGVVNGDAHIPFNCCGGCRFFAPEVQVFYWPTLSPDGCSQSNATTTSRAILPSPSNDAQTAEDPDSSGIAGFTVVDGSTLTFPSLYLAIHGAISVEDECGVRGNTYYNPTIAIPPGDLSTLSFHGTDLRFEGYEPSTGLYDPGVCHTYGLSNGTTTSYLNVVGVSSWSTTIFYTMGPPYNPILLPPTQLTALDPEWEACTAWETYGDNAYAVFFGLYDPPRALTREPALAHPSTTSSESTTQPTVPVARPAGQNLPTAAKITTPPAIVADPNGPSDETQPTAAVAQPGEASLPAAAKITEPSSSENGSSDPVTSDTGVAGFIIKPFKQDPNSNTKENENPSPTTGVKIIYPNPSGSSQPIITVDGHPYTANEASQYIIGSQTLSPGGSTIHVNNVDYSLATSPIPTAKSDSILSALSADNKPRLTVDGKVHTANSASQYIIGSQTLVPDGPSVTINNIPYALPSSPTAIISADSTISLSPNTTPDAAFISILSAAGLNLEITDPVLTIDGKPYTAKTASQYLIRTRALVPGGPTITVNNIYYALDLSPSLTALISAGSTTPLEPTQAPDAEILSMLSAAGLGSGGVDPIITINGNTYTADSASQYVIGTQTLNPNGPTVTVNNIPYALVLSPSLTAFISAGHTVPLNLSPTQTAQEENFLSRLSAAGFLNGALHTYTIDGMAFTGDATSLAAGSMTLMPGSPPLVTSGHTFALGTVGEIVVDETTGFLTSEPSGSGGVGSATMGVSDGNGSSGAVFMGGAGCLRPGGRGLGLGGLVWVFMW